LKKGLKLKNKKLVAYAMDFASFLIEMIDYKELKRIILFGSAARNEANEKSDVDLFIESDSKSIEKEIKKIKDDFFSSRRYKDYWHLKGINNDINISVGKIDDWKNLKNSIISNGILLYSKYYDSPANGKYKTLLYWENVKPESKRVAVSKRLFGYKKGKKRYTGLIQKYNGEKLGKGIIAVLSENEFAFLKLFKEMKITVKIKKIIEYA
jgi:predicted nucleotidyltransferase